MFLFTLHVNTLKCIVLFHFSVFQLSAGSATCAVIIIKCFSEMFYLRAPRRASAGATGIIGIYFVNGLTKRNYGLILFVKQGLNN